MNIYETQILQRLCQNEDIQLLLDNGRPDYDKNNLKWNLIIPDVYVPKATESAETYITFGLSGEAISKTEKRLIVDFYVFCHESLLRTKNGKRTTLIAAAIDKEFNGTNEVALGVMEFAGFDGNFSVGRDYHGYQLTYEIRDYNNLTYKNSTGYAK